MKYVLVTVTKSAARLRIHALVLGLLTLLTASPASATTLISNLPISVGGSTGDFAVNNNLAAGFVLPAGVDYSLDSVTLQMTVFQAATSVTVTLHGGSAAAPSGAALATFLNPAFTLSSTNQAVFTPTAPFTLLASTNYWIVLDGAGSTLNSVTWDGSIPGVTATGLATFLGQTGDSSLPPTTPLTTSNRFGFQVDATAVPEPSTWLLAGLAALGCAAMRRRR